MRDGLIGNCCCSNLASVWVCIMLLALFVLAIPRFIMGSSLGHEAANRYMLLVSVLHPALQLCAGQVFKGSR